MNGNKITRNRGIGRIIGYQIARKLSEDSEPVYIMGIRIHHYNLLFLSLFVDNKFLKGVLEGAGLEDLPDLLEDLQRKRI